ncbi:Choline O-acetyltransferase [Schistosoma japonicum]|uniref:Choline O-acetyltransferase n=1 Tax=Schistosoma japonicum TaxID=6182 RepID=A0A4Z2DB67_SCHJA|nr:Choline O-acetyltransferase [Schistosoma japonicum]
MSHPIKEFVRRLSNLDIERYPEWDLSKPLPRLPVPDLHNTLDRYLRLIAPVVSKEDFERTKQLVEEFGKPDGEGEKLQNLLKEYAKTKVNWVTEWWLDDMYLLNPAPLPINSSPGMVFPRHSFISARQQLRFAAQLISGILDYKTILDTRSLPIERARHSKKGQPFCMEQYYRLFSSYRYPGKTKDVLTTTAERDPFEPEHIIVIYLDQFFVIDVITNGSRLSEEDIYNQLRRVTQFAEESVAGESEMEVQPKVGALTALPRNKWAEVYQRLSQDSENQDNLKVIAKSMFVLCLDKPIIPVEELDETTDINGYLNDINDYNNLNKRDDVSLALQLLHGMGSSFNAANRWYDKTMQFIISRDGNCGLNYEHSVAEGIAVVRLIEHILQYMKEVKRWKLVRFPSVCELAYPRRLKWNLDDNAKSMIDYALNEIDKIADDLDLYILRYEQYGREFPKTVNMSPDSFIQLALQLAHFKLHNYLVPTYESASTRRFALARVDNIRACSMPALEWCKAMTGQTKCSTDEKIRLLRKAMEWQTEIMLETILGHGVDNHLLGLRQIALTHGKELPNIFKDPSYMESNRFRLSTSQVPTTMDAFMCYGAVVPNGYGAAYNPHPDNIVVVISCWRTNPDNNAAEFAKMLQSAFTEMRELVLSNPVLAKQPSNEPVEWSIAKSLGADVGLNVTG